MWPWLSESQFPNLTNGGDYIYPGPPPGHLYEKGPSAQCPGPSPSTIHSLTDSTPVPGPVPGILYWGAGQRWLFLFLLAPQPDYMSSLPCREGGHGTKLWLLDAPHMQTWLINPAPPTRHDLSLSLSLFGWRGPRFEVGGAWRWEEPRFQNLLPIFSLGGRLCTKTAKNC